MLPTAIMDQFYTGEEQPLVSISCITFNHYNYIRETIEGFLAQKTTFSVEILIHDDASTDGTQTIIKEFENKYPNLILPIYQSENQYSRGVKISSTYNWPRAKGKYIAMCEGDDYWTDPLKLQKQINNLELNSDYILSHSNCDFLFQTSGKIIKNVDKYSSTIIVGYGKKDLFYNLLSYELKVRLPSVVFRWNEKSKILSNIDRFQTGDIAHWLDLSQLGKFHFLEESTCVYRIHSGSVSRPKRIKKELAFRLSGLELRFHYCDKYNYDIPQMLIDKYNELAIDYIIFGGKYDELNNQEYLTPNSKQKIKLYSNKFFKFFGRISYYIKRPSKVYSKILNILKR